MKSPLIFSALFAFIALFTTKAQNVGIGVSSPKSKLSVNGNLSVGTSYISNAAPTNGAIIQGSVGIGTSSPAEKLHIIGSIRGNQSGAIRISTGSGYVDVGPKNSSWSHFYTDRARFYFNKQIWVDGGVFSSYNSDMFLRTTGTTRIRVSRTTGNVGIGSIFNTNNPNPSAKLEIYSTNSGLLIPRLTTTQRNTISNPANSLIIFNTTTKCLEMYNSSSNTWEKIHCFDCSGSLAAPTVTNATSVNAHDFIANWNSVSGATSYELDVAFDASFSNFAPGYYHLNVGNVNSFHVYLPSYINIPTSCVYYRVRAITDCGKSSFSSGKFVGTAASGSQSFYVNGTFTVPCGVTSINVKVWGAGGGGAGHGGPGGGGACVIATIPVTPGETLTIRVGQPGHPGGGCTGYPSSGGVGGSGYGNGGYGGDGDGGDPALHKWGGSGGGGGGGSAILRGSTPLVVAGGGGGGGASWSLMIGNKGGGGGQNGSGGGTGGAGGVAGASSNLNGTNGEGSSSPGDNKPGAGGGGGGKNGGTGGQTSASSSAGGGGGGNSYIHPSVTGTIYNGNYQTPGKSTDPDLPNGRAIGGTGGCNPSIGGVGFVKISW